MTDDGANLSIDVERDIDDLCRKYRHVPPRAVRQIYLAELAAMESRARVHAFIGIIVKRKAQNVIATQFARPTKLG
jgi:hypothetical protein